MGTDCKERKLEWWERCQLESQGCRAADWTRVRVKDDTALASLRDVEFVGDVSLGSLNAEAGDVIERVRLVNCKIGDYVTIRNVGSIEFEPESPCGLGTEVCVLDESGSRPVAIYPGLSAQMALLMARMPKWTASHLRPIISDYLDSITVEPRIGNGSRIENCGTLVNVAVGNDITISGALSLRNGMVINNAQSHRGLAYVGQGVDAENFIFEDAHVDSSAIIRNCYVGQGAIIEKDFSAHDSLFFANCHLENGEACALFAGPYTVSMHKSSLLIGCQTSFMNAGSGTNQSNHMYKLGPVHWGILERGVKTSSDSYLMLGAKIGAFSLLMGQHKTHPDSSEFPFSYLFGDDRGATVVVPGVMLRSCGLLRDEKKWPARDRRLKRKLPLHDRIVFDVLNPLTVDRMLQALDAIENLLIKPADDDRMVRYRGMKFSRASLERAKRLYELGVYKYLSLRMGKESFPVRSEHSTPAEWVDIAGLPMPRHLLQKAMKGESIREIEAVFSEAERMYTSLEKAWISSRIGSKWQLSPEAIAVYASEFDKMVEEDRARYLDELSAQNDMLAL